MPKATTPASRDKLAMSIGFEPGLDGAAQAPPSAVLVSAEVSGQCPGPSAIKSAKALQAGAVRVHIPV